MLKILSLVILSALALYGGVTLTGRLKFILQKTAARIIARNSMPCRCGCEDVIVAFGEDQKSILLACPKCGRIVSSIFHDSARETVQAWNEGKTDAGESDEESYDEDQETD